MNQGPNITSIAALIGDHARAQALTVLMGGKALTATELADAASVTRQTMSTHLAQLVDAGLLAVHAQGRHRYFRIAHADVAHMLEVLMGVTAGDIVGQPRTGPRDPALRKARVCYNHLAGELGVLMYDRMVQRGAFSLDGEGLLLTEQGKAHVEELGLALSPAPHGAGGGCRGCMDWSERRNHLAGPLGTALLARFETLEWVKRVERSRALAFSARGEAALRAWLG